MCLIMLMDNRRCRVKLCCVTQGPEAGEGTMCSSHWAHEGQDYMGDEDGVDQVNRENDGVIALGGD
jgi:hypothetical protein